MSFFISDAFAQAAPAAAQQGSPLTGVVFMVALIGLFYFMLIRPQSKRAKEHRKMVETLAKGDEIVTNGGLLGKIIALSEQYVTVELTEGVQVKLQRQSVATVLPKGTIKSA